MAKHTNDNRKAFDKRVKQLKKQIREFERIGYRGADENLLSQLQHTGDRVSNKQLQAVMDMTAQEVFRNGYVDLPTGEHLPVSKMRELGLTREDLREFRRKGNDLEALGEKRAEKLIDATDTAHFYKTVGQDLKRPKKIDYDNIERSTQEKMNEIAENLSKKWDEVLQEWDGVGHPNYASEEFIEYSRLANLYGLDNVKPDSGEWGIDSVNEIIEKAQAIQQQNIDITEIAIKSIADAVGYSNYDNIFDNPALTLLEEVYEQALFAKGSDIAGMVVNLIDGALQSGVDASQIADLVSQTGFASGEGFSAFYDDEKLANISALRDGMMSLLEFDDGEEMPFYLESAFNDIDAWIDETEVGLLQA